MYKLNKIPKEWLLLIIIAIIVVVIGIFEWNKTSIRDRALTETILDRRSSPDGGRISNEEGDVTVLVEYLAKESNNPNMVFQVTLDTHSVDLDAFDFQKEITLEKDSKPFSPNVISQEGSVHHRKAELTFKEVTLPFVIIVNNLAGISRREFKFTTLN